MSSPKPDGGAAFEIRDYEEQRAEAERHLYDAIQMIDEQAAKAKEPYLRMLAEIRAMSPPPPIIFRVPTARQSS